MESSARFINIHKEITEIINSFLFEVSHISDNSRYASVLKKGHASFGYLKIGNKDFYNNYKELERGLESVIRDKLINPILAKLFERDDTLTCNWPQLEKEFVFFSNSSFENQVPFEFIVHKNNESIGYRYTDVGSYDETKYLIKSYNIDRIEIIEWDNIEKEERYQIPWANQLPSLPLYYVSLKWFLEQYFPHNIIDIFIKRTQSAVTEASTIIGFDTIPRLTPSHLSSFKSSVETALHNTNFENMQYQTLNNGKPVHKQTKKRLSLGDYSILNNYFFKNNLYLSIVNNLEFSRCFITSEYLFSILQDDNLIDYTTIVSGYFKSIEQLLFLLMKYYLGLSSPTDNIFIKCEKRYKANHPDFRENPAPKANRTKQVRFLPEYEECFSTSMASLAWLLHDNDTCWNISQEGQKVVHSTLLDYIDECRNEHFHKDNIYNYSLGQHRTIRKARTELSV